MKDRDIVADILARVETAVRVWALDHGVNPAMIDALVVEVRAQDKPIRKDWARCEPYIAARGPGIDDAKRRAIEEAGKSGKIAEAASRNGISRATMYRLLKK